MDKSIVKIIVIATMIYGFSAVESLALHIQGEPHETESGYVGSETCGKCHREAYKAWGETRLARALLSLGPRKAMKVKKKMGLDPLKDYTRDPNCLKCHTTGFEMKANGAYNFIEYGIGCEVCHGAGKKYSEIMKTKGKRYKRKELVEAGLNLDFETTCLKCHNEESPLIDNEYIFSHRERYKEVHGTIELKYHKKIERFKDKEEEGDN